MYRAQILNIFGGRKALFPGYLNILINFQVIYVTGKLFLKFSGFPWCMGANMEAICFVEQFVKKTKWVLEVVKIVQTTSVHSVTS